MQISILVVSTHRRKYYTNVYEVTVWGGWGGVTLKFVIFKNCFILLCIWRDAFNFLSQVDLQIGMFPGPPSDCKMIFIS